MTVQLPVFAFCAALAVALNLLSPPLCAQTVAGARQRRAGLHKCDPWLKRYLLMETVAGGRSASVSTAGSLKLFVTGDPADLPSLVHALGGRIGTLAGPIATVTIPRRSLDLLLASDHVDRLELAMPVELDQDSVRRHVHADRAHRGDAPLQQPITGEGVILGVIDTGIDFMHPEFLAADGTTRVLSIWSQTEPEGPAPEGFDYGTEWNRDRIDAALAGASELVSHIDEYGHGTHVTAIAAGTHGMAPDAEIIMVQFHNTFEALTTDVLDAAAYIYRRASAEGKPCVINASLGTNSHFHDGSDPISRGLAALLAESPGRIFVASAGNRGGRKWHWGGSAEQDSLWTFSNPQDVWIRIPDSNLAGFEISVQFQSPETLGAQTPWRNVAEIASTTGFVDSLDSITVGVAASSLGNGYTGVIVDLGPASGMFRILVRGGGEFDAWSQRFLSNLDPSSLNSRYRAVDSTMSIGSPGIAADAITVGSYINRSSYQTANRGMFPSPPAKGGALSSFSSIGPRSDGLVKPDIVAPGENVISARSRGLDLKQIGDWQLLRDTFYIPNSGTSMASPVVAGAVALYLQMHPGATVDEVRAALVRSAVRDAYTDRSGSLPNGQWGAGKLDVFGMLTGVATGAPEPVAIVRTGLLRSVPVPASDRVVIGYDRRSGEAGTLMVYNAIGMVVARMALAVGSDRVALDVAAWPSGIYRCVVSRGDGVEAGSVVVSR